MDEHKELAGDTTTTTTSAQNGGYDNIGDDGDENVWQYFLQEASSSGRRFNEGHVVVLGDANCGKTAIVSLMGKLEARSNEMKRFLMMRYSYIHLTDADTDEPTAQLNIWQISEPSHMRLLDVVIQPKQMAAVAYIICVDLSQPHSVEEQFNKWMDAATHTQERLLERLPADKRAELKRTISSRIQFYVNPKDADAKVLTEAEKADIPLKTEVPEINLGCPVIIVGTKSDMFRTLYQSDADANDRYDVIMLYIRLWSLKYGASVFNMAKGLKEQGLRILQYLDDSLFGTEFSRAPNVVVALSNILSKTSREDAFLFVPTGYDSEGIISAQAGGRELTAEFYQQCFPPPQKGKDSQKQKKTKLKADNDQTFYNTLNFDMREAQGSMNKGGAPSTTISGVPTSTAAAKPAPKLADNNQLGKLLLGISKMQTKAPGH